jgi:methionyl-tRNA formyltransferase
LFGSVREWAEGGNQGRGKEKAGGFHGVSGGMQCRADALCVRTEAEIVNFVRGLCPYPAAWTTIQGKTFKIFKVTSDDGNRSSDLSTSGIATDNKSYLCIKSIDGRLSIEELQAEGKRKMTIKEFFAGNKI